MTVSLRSQIVMQPTQMGHWVKLRVQNGDYGRDTGFPVPPEQNRTGAA